MCVELTYDVISKNYLSFGVNGKQLILQHAITMLQHANLTQFAFQRSIL